MKRGYENGTKRKSGLQDGARGFHLYYPRFLFNIRKFPSMAETPLAARRAHVHGVIMYLVPASLVSAELATGWPQTGGVYVWVKQAFGQRWGFAAVWLQWFMMTIAFVVALSTIAATLAYVFNPALASNKPFQLPGNRCGMVGPYTDQPEGSEDLLVDKHHLRDRRDANSRRAADSWRVVVRPFRTCRAHDAPPDIEGLHSELQRYQQHRTVDHLRVPVHGGGDVCCPCKGNKECETELSPGSAHRGSCHGRLEHSGCAARRNDSAEQGP